MGFWDKLKGELIDVIEWTDDSRDTLAWRFPTMNKEIQTGGHLVVREGQAAMFVDNGQFADLFGPGKHTLDTSNLPILTTLKHWTTGFRSPFKSEVYFVNRHQFNDQRWGTPQPVMLRDADFGIVRLRAHGVFAFRVDDVKTFLLEVVGTKERTTVEDVTNHLRQALTSGFSDAVAEAGIPALDLARKYDELAVLTKAKLQPAFARFGLVLTDLTVANVSLPPEVEKALDERTSMGAVGNMGTYQQYRFAKGLGGPGGGAAGDAAAGIAGLAMGLEMARGVMAGHMSAGGASPSIPPVSGWPGGVPPAALSGGHGHAPEPATPAHSATGSAPCWSCKAPVPANSKFCNDCGAPQQKKRCPDCNHELEARARFCDECGHKFG